ncbi:MAG: response regulator [Verrucomicrobiota bacterium]|nr:response regulator [Verrucomicrobiota bacterium]
MLTASLPTFEAPKAVGGASIYVVDDERMVGEVVEVILGMEGFKCRYFENPKDAYEAFLTAEERPDLLLTDYVMHPLNGMELLARCKDLEPGLRSVLYSGNVGTEILRQHTLQPDAFIAKPFLPKDLVRLVKKVLSA